MQSGLKDMSAYCFESYLGQIKSLLRSPNKLLAQYCRRIHEKELHCEQKNNDNMVEIREIIEDEDNEIKLHVQHLIIKKPVFKHPVDSSVLDIWGLKNEVREKITIVKLGEIKSKLIKFKINFSISDEERIFVMALLH
ncbi:hypothetical protein PV327_001621 [Microctonus hyperodae]|uniref:Uncharacterized protein n=1 Tax=Microctonus hyperodae TaxID=165561 RepID=A0AA39KNE8_MICHY|nr:hypothetical protein PV327_001621 [Microctonus hyperodae]